MKILFIGNTRLGDAILSTSILNYYNKKDTVITVVCSPLSKAIYRNFPNVNNIISVVKKKRAKHWLEVYNSLDREYWDLVIDLRNTLISRVIRKKNVFRLNNINHNEHRVNSLCKLLKIDYTISPSIPINSKIIKKSLEVLASKKLTEPILAIAPVTNWKRKNWPRDNFALLVNKLVEESKKKVNFKSIVIIGSKDEKEQCEYLKSKIKKIPVVNLCGRYDIIMIYALLKKCKLFIGNDSGLMHLSAAAKINTLGLFGPSREINYRPWGKKSYFLRTKMKYEELVNTKGYDRYDNRSLMESLTVDKVLKKCLEIIN